MTLTKPFRIAVILHFAIFLLLLFLFLPALSPAVIRSTEGTVTKVTDGDTIQVTTPEGTRLKVRLYGIDAPETEKRNRRTGRVNKPGQPFGTEAMEALDQKVFNKRVKLDIVDIDRYRRMVSIVWLGNRNINLEMVREGFAEAYTEYLKPPYREDFLRAEGMARAEKGYLGYKQL